MSVRTQRVPVPGGPPAVEVRNPAGSVTVDAVEGASEVVVTIEPLNEAAEHEVDLVDVEATASAVRVRVPERRLSRSPAFAVAVSTPPDGPVVVSTASGDSSLRGRLGRVVLTSASGDVAVEHCTTLQARAASGDVRVGEVTGAATVGTASGDVRLESAGGPLEVRTASGDLVIGDAAGDVRARTASGDVRVERAARGTLRLTTVSGDVTVGVERGLRVRLDVQTLTGHWVSELTEEAPGAAEGDTAALTLFLQSVSGDLRVHRATASTPPAPETSLAS
ncbi:DUF4097 family beta strand repeat-containing protein [Modestobacter marinus]|uniref:DUF4097 family beta strand repeat-containing protein n=1 Tax=Modestobacter marinus TaxID=477641 RepID=UPI001C95111E|nr:DUF4097 family beta strand repeat-containing protein [Modestobacter marinus]